MRRGCGRWPSGTMRIAHRRTAARPRAKPRWRRSRRAGGRATAGSADEHADVAPDLFTAETPLGTYQGITERILSRTPASFRTVLVPRGSSKPEWLAR